MFSSDQLVDLIKEKYGFYSDNDVAKELGVSRACISRYRSLKGSWDDKLAVEIAEILNLEPLCVLASMRIERAKRRENPDEIVFWKKYASRYEQ